MTMTAAPLEAVSMASIGDMIKRCMIYLSFFEGNSFAVNFCGNVEVLTLTQISGKPNVGR
jgi:hypothetical protein